MFYTSLCLVLHTLPDKLNFPLLADKRMIEYVVFETQGCFLFTGNYMEQHILY